MELVYLWVEKKHKNIERQGFNLSPKFHCKFYAKYDEDNKLKKDCKLTIKKLDYINILPKNINIIPIIGRNGSGKSALIETIINDIIFHIKYEDDTQILYCYLDNDKNKIYINSSYVDESKIDSDIPYELTHYKISDKNFYFGVKKDFKIEYDKSFFYLYNYSLEPDYGIHTIYEYNEELLFYCEVNKLDGIIDLDKEIDKNYKLFLKLFKDNKESSKLNRDIFFIPTELIIEREILSGYFFSNTKEEKYYHEFIKLNSIGEIIMLETLLYLRFYIKDKDLIQFKKEIESINNFFIDKNIVEEFHDICGFFVDESKKILFKIDFIKKEIREEGKKHNDFYLTFLNELKKIFLLLINSRYFIEMIEAIDDDSLYYNIKQSILDEEDNLLYLKNLPNYLQISFLEKNGKNFSSLSSGEKHLLRLLYSIDNIISIREDTTDTFYIFLDEVENTLHPNWQKKLINWLIEYFKHYEDKQINFFIASHSPFILSDIPKQNIIFLDKDENEKCKVLTHDEVLEKEQTFGANIHTLLSDSFFMENGLMGEFAKSKINEIKIFYETVVKENQKKESDFSLLKIEYEENKTKFEHIQSIIGEPFLKTIIKNQLEEIESILFGSKAKKIAIERFIKEFGEDAISEVMKNDKN